MSASEDADEKPYATVRDLIGDFIGQKLLDITQHDRDEYEANGEAYIILHFESGGLKVVLDQNNAYLDIKEFEYGEDS